MTKLHQILAVAQGTKQRAQQALTKFYHQVQKPEPFTGLIKTYRPKDEEGEQLPGEGVRVQLDAAALLQGLKAQLAPMYKVVGDIDRTNMIAAASVIVDGKVILADVPVATLLWLEKQLADMRTVFNTLPTLNPEFTWTRDEATGVWTTAERVPPAPRRSPATTSKPRPPTSTRNRSRCTTKTSTSAPGTPVACPARCVPPMCECSRNAWRRCATR